MARCRGASATPTALERERCRVLAARMGVSERVLARRIFEIGLGELERQADGGTFGGVLDVVAGGLEVLEKLQEAGDHLFGHRPDPDLGPAFDGRCPDLTGVVVRRRG